MKILISIAAFFRKVIRTKYGAVAAATASVIALYGYTFGSFDQIIYLPFLFKTFHPDLYRLDPFLQLKNHYYSFFWILLQPLYRYGILEIGLFILHILTVFLTFLSIRNLASVFSRNKTFLMLSVFGFVVPHIGISGFTLFEFSILNRTFALPFLIQSVAWYLSGRRYRAFLMIGVMANIHSIYALIVAASLLADALITEKDKMSRMFKYILILGVSSVPVIAWFAAGTIANHAYFDVYRWLALMRSSLLSHLFAPWKPNFINIFLGSSAAGMLVLYGLMFRKLHMSHEVKSIHRFVGVYGVIVVIYFLTVSVMPLEFVAKTQAIRAGLFIMFFIYFLYYVSIFRSRESKELDQRQFNFLAVAGCLSVTPLVLLAAYLIRIMIKGVQIYRISILILFIAFIIQMGLLYKFGVYKAGFRIFSPQTAYVDIQRFAARTTGVDSVFIAVPYFWEIHESEWRVYSRRATVVSYSDSLEIAYYPPYYNTWKERMDTLMPGWADSLTGDYFTDRQQLKHLYYGNTAGDFAAAGKKYRARYLVVEKPYCYPFKPMYENRQFILYDMSVRLPPSECTVNARGT